MASFTEALSKAVDTVEKPKPKPAGMYRSMISGMPQVKKVNTKEGEREVLAFNTKPIMAVEVEDQDALSKAGDLNQWPPQSIDFWDGEGGEYAAVQFMTNVLGIDPGPKGKAKTIGQMCAEAAGKQLLTPYENYPYTDRAGEMQIGTRIKQAGMAKV